MSLKPFFTYFGGKYRIAPKYPAPKHGAVVESFAGSAGYALRYPDRAVSLCEKNEQIASMWQWLIRARVTEILELPDIEQGQSVDDLRVHQDAKTLIGFWCNKATTHPSKRLSAWSVKYPEQFWGDKIRYRVATQVDAIRHWKVYSDFTSVNGTATWFIDPPYQGQGHRYKEHAIDYVSLREWCESRRGQVIVCEAAGADWAPFVPFHESKSRKGKCSEVLWTFEA